MFINKSNSIIQNSSFDLDTIELKVLSKIISMINSKSETFQYYYEFELKDFKNELSLHETNYTQLKEAVRQLSNKGFEIIKDNNTDVYSRWISSVITEKGTGNIKVEIPKEMREYYLNLNTKYTSVKAIYIYKLRSKYSIRLYELLSSWKTRGNISYTLEELKKMFKIDSKYKRFYDFKRKVIEVAQKEFIKKEIDINFTYKSSGRGTNKKIYFEITDAKEEKEKQEATKKQEIINNSNSFDQENYQESQDYLKYLGMKEKEINKIIANNEEMKIRRNINYTIKFGQTHKFEKSELAFFRYAIKKDIAMSNHQEKQEYKENKEEKEKKNFNKPLPMEIDQEIKPIEKQKQELKDNPFLYRDFINFLKQFIKDNPQNRRVPNIITDLENDIESIDYNPDRLTTELMISRFFKSRE